MYVEFEHGAPDGKWRGQTWICPAGARTVKFNASVRASDALLLQPTVDLMWRSLKID